MTSQRGRPKNTGKNDDRPLLAIATMLVSGEAKAYDEAAAAVYLTHKPTDTYERKAVMDRWRGKWKKSGAIFMDQARTPIVRYVHGPSTDSLFMSDAQRVQLLHMESAQEELKTVLKNLGMTPEEFKAKSAEVTEHLRNPMVRMQLDQLMNGGLQAAMAAFRKYQSNPCPNTFGVWGRQPHIFPIDRQS